MNRALSPKFMNDLQEGMLQPLLERVRKDDTLMLAIRENYINVYYRGGNIIKLEEICPNKYMASFDGNYAGDRPERLSKNLPRRIDSKGCIEPWIESIPARKEVMDFWFHEHPKDEREFQQLVARENNVSGGANESEYFISDIELTNSEIGARFDMLAFKWPAEDRKSGKIQLALVEMKYRDSALSGESGIVEHFKQMSAYLAKGENRASLAGMAEEQINQLNSLALIRHTKGVSRKFEVDDKRFEIIFLFANSNPRSSKLSNELKGLKELLNGTAEKNFDLRFFVANSAGYAMHIACMMDFCQYNTFLNRSQPCDSSQGY